MLLTAPDSDGEILALKPLFFEEVDPEVTTALLRAVVVENNPVELAHIYAGMAHLLLDADTRVQERPSPHRVAIPFGYLFAALQRPLNTPSLPVPKEMQPYMRLTLLIGRHDKGDAIFESIVSFMHIAADAEVPLVSYETQRILAHLAMNNPQESPQLYKELLEQAHDIALQPMAEVYQAFGWEIDPDATPS